MEWLNYHHLLYFWTVAREGSISAASRKLRLAQPTVSGQIRALEEAIGEKLLERSGRKVALTEVGNVVYRYADEIFSLGRELMDTLKGRPTGRPHRLVVGISDGVPKLIAYRLIEPALRMPEPVRVVCQEDRPERLLAELALHNFDLVLSDAPVGAGTSVRAFSHLLGETSVTVFAAPRLAARLRRKFPASLDGSPMLMPGEGSPLRRSLSHWLDVNGIRPEVVGEFQDTALLKVFGQAGAGAFPGPSAIEREIEAQYQVEAVGRLDGVRERFYAISVERKMKHPAALAISQVARLELFAPERPE